MESLIIICEVLKNEVNFIIEKMIKSNIIKSMPEIIYVDSKYHNNPDNLKLKLQEIIDQNKEYERIILLYGQCGNAVLELKSDYSKLVMPKVSDCISLYLGGNDKRKQIKDSERTYFFSKGYMENDNSLYSEMLKLKEKYGEEDAIDMYKMVICNYKHIGVIDTKAYDLEDIMDKIKSLCDDLDLNYEVVEGDLSIMEKSLLGIVDDSFIIKEIGEKVSYKDFE